MVIFDLLEKRIEENSSKPVLLYDLLEARIREGKVSDELWRLLAARIKHGGEGSNYPLK